MTTTYEIDDESALPFGMLNNDFNFSIKIEGETWVNCSQYIYVNCIRYILNHNSVLHHHQKKYVDTMMKLPTYETYKDILSEIADEVNYNFYYKEILAKIASDSNFAFFLSKSETPIINSESPIFQNVIESVKSKLSVKEYYDFYPAYIVIKIIIQMLTHEVDDFSKIQIYLQLCEKKKTSIIHDIIKDYQFSKLKKLDVYDFETEVSENGELLKVLQLSHCYPTILFIFAFKYYLRQFNERMNSKYENKILELFLKYKHQYKESVKKQIYLVNNDELKKIILEKVLEYDDKFRNYIAKDESLRLLINSKISDEKILEYENFNFYEINETNIKIKTTSNVDKTEYVSFLTTLSTKITKESQFPDNLERIKEVLATIVIYKKFNLPLPDNYIENYRNNLPEFLKKHILFNPETDRKYIDMQFSLFLCKSIQLTYKSDDITLSKLVGGLLSNLSTVFKSETFGIYKSSEDVKVLLDNDLFMKLWLEKQLKYLSNFVSCIYLFLESNQVKPTNENLLEALKIFSDNVHFFQQKTTYDELPLYFVELVDSYFDTAMSNDKKMFTTMIWNFVTFNLQTILKTRNVFKTKLFLYKNILRLRQFHQCVENKDNNDIACFTFAVINVSNKLDKLRQKCNIGPVNLANFVQAIILNRKLFDDENKNEDSMEDIAPIINRIFEHNRTVIKTVLTENQIVEIVKKIQDTDDIVLVNLWVNIFL